MSMTKIPALDGVRGAALLMVFACHSRTLSLDGGYVGVDVFFVLSGFLITSILLGEIQKTGTLNFFNFYVRRALRLFPALFGFTALVVLFASIFDREHLSEVGTNAVWIVFYLFNWLRVVALPSSDGIYPHFGHLWSLSVEEQFYILWPAVLFIALRSANPERNFGRILAIGIIAPAVARLILFDSKAFLFGYFRTDLRLDSLMWGALGAWLYSTGRLDFLNQMKSRSLVPSLAALSVLLIATFPILANGFLSRGGYTLLGALTMFVILTAAVGQDSALQSFLTSRFMRWTGKISYGLYIYHLPIFAMAYKTPLPEWLQSAVAIVSVYVVAGLSFRYFETPFLRMKDRFTSGRRGAGMATQVP